MTDETEAAGGEVNFTLVEPGTDVETFAAGIPEIISGVPWPDYILTTAGAVGHSMSNV